MRSVLKMTQTLFGTLLLSLFLRIYLPRVLGVETMGRYYFAEAFPALFFTFLNFGIESYLRRSIPGHPERLVSAFFSILVFQLVATLVLLAILFAALKSSPRASDLSLTIMIMGVYWAAASVNRNVVKQGLIALHHVDVTSRAEILIKIVCVVGVAVSAYFTKNLAILAGAAAISELFGLALLLAATRRLGLLPFRFDGALLRQIIVTSLPFMATAIFSETYSNVDASMVGAIAGPEELGYYGAATRLRGVFLLFLTVIANGLMPYMSETFHRARDQYGSLVNAFVRTTACGSFFLGAALLVFSDVATTVLYGADFHPSARIVAILSPTIPMTYVCVLVGCHLTVTTSGRLLATIQIGSIALDAAANYALIGRGVGWWGAGGAGLGAALSSVVSQSLATCAMVFIGTRGGSGFSRAVVLRLTALSTLPLLGLLLTTDKINATPVSIRALAFLVMVPVYVFASGLLKTSDLGSALAYLRKRGRPVL